MGERIASLSFAITGDFVTRTAREWLWLEGKPWSVVEEFLLSCMCGTDKSKEELSELAFKVVSGRAKFIGNTADDSYAMVDDDQDFIGDYIGRWNRKVKELEKENRELENQHYMLTNYLIDSGRGYLLAEAGVAPESKDLDPLGAAMLKSYMEQDAIEKAGFTDNYGWLEPNGTFHPVDYADHQEFARKTAEERGWIREFAKTEYGGIYAIGDFLVEDKGWVLLHNPGRGIARAEVSEKKPLTKAQKDFLFGYYADRGKHDLAQKYLEE